MYVVIEGIDTAGKSTQLEILKQRFPDAIFTKEPGATNLGVKLRTMALSGEAKNPIAEMFLFLADRAEHYQEVVVPNQKKLLISDRGMFSGIAYAKQLPMDKVIDLNLIALDQNLPDKVIMLELPREELIFRLSQKAHDGIESRGIDYLMEIQERMKSTIKRLDIEACIIDASQSIEEIALQIEEFIL